jgi:hypothetical protein
MKRWIVFVGLSALIFAFGVSVGTYKIFPYKQVKFTYQQLKAVFNIEKPDIPNPEKSKINQQYLSFLQHDFLSPEYKIKKTAILNTLVEKYNYQSYLEIGQGTRTNNFDWINCKIKIGVDPDRSLNAAYQITSDEFFAVNNDSYDLIFIDGLHHADQVMRDIINSLNVLTENGTILVHDCNPADKKMQMVPRIAEAGWTGDVWKAWAELRATRDDLIMYVIDADYGCGVIRRGKQELIDLPEILTYEFFNENRERILNLIDVNSFLNGLK